MTDPVRALADEATPGPWEAEETFGNIFEIVETIVGTVVTTIDASGSGPDRPMLWADARLIALAPELARVAADLFTQLAHLDVTRAWGEDERPEVIAALAAYEQLQTRARGE